MIGLSSSNSNVNTQLNADTLQLDIQISCHLVLSADEARQKLSRYLIDQVSLFFTPQNPLLLIQDNEHILWQFPIVLTWGTQGQLGLIGNIAVNAQTGDILLTQESQKRLEANACLLIRGATSLANP